MRKESVGAEKAWDQTMSRLHFGNDGSLGNKASDVLHVVMH